MIDEGEFLVMAPAERAVHALRGPWRRRYAERRYS